MSNLSTKGLEELFFSGFSASDAIVKSSEKKTFVDENLFEPKPKESQDGVYSALVRFLPHIYQDERATYFPKATVWLKEYNGTKSFPVDTPYQGKGQWNNCPIKKLSWELYDKGKKQGDAIAMQKSRDLDVKLNYYSLVQIVRDKVHPENENKIFIYKFPETIKKTLEAFLAGSEFESGINCFDIMNPSPLFEIKLSNEQKNINGRTCNVPSYGKCQFINKTSGFLFEDGTEVNIEDKESRSKMLEIIKQKSELINKYRFEPWDEETRAKVNSILKTYTDNSDEVIVSNIKTSVLNTTNSVSATPQQVVKQEVASTPSSSNDGQKDLLEELLEDDDL